MAVIKEWNCGACGLDFDSELQVCHRCGATDPHVTRAFRTPPGFKSDTTKVTDQSLQNFTSLYGLSDYSNNPSTKHEKNFDHLWKDPKEIVSAPDADESKADVIKNIMADAVKPITSQKVVVAKERAA